MKPEQRLLLALSLTLGILILWQALVPPAPEPVVKPSLPQSGVSALKGSSAPEPIFDFTVKSIHLGIGINRGGIQRLYVDGARLLAESNPCILETELLQPTPEKVLFQSHEEGGLLLSQAQLASDKATISRRISPSIDHNYLIDLKLNLVNNSPHTQPYQLRMLVYQPLYAPSPQDRRYQEGAALIGEKTHRLHVKPGQIQRFGASPVWVTAQGKSHALIVQPTPPIGTFHVEQSPAGLTTGWLELPKVELSPGGQAEWNFRLYAGPMTLANLKEVGLEEAVSLGSFSGISKLLLKLLTWSQGWLHNYGWAIVFLSFGIWIIFFPLTWSGIRMMKVMGQIQPQMERIRKEHGKNPQKMNQEILELYKKYRVNPLSGCLPLVLQMPIFIALYQVLSRAPELRRAGFLWIKDLSEPDAAIRFGSSVPILGESLNILPILMAIAMLFQQRMTQQPQAALTQEQQIQQKMFRWFPLLFGFLFYRLPSGLVLYWVTNTSLTLSQYLLSLRFHRHEQP